MEHANIGNYVSMPEAQNAWLKARILECPSGQKKLSKKEGCVWTKL